MYKDYVSIDFIFRAGTDCCVPIAGAIFKNLLALVETPFSQVQGGDTCKIILLFYHITWKKKIKTAGNQQNIFLLFI